MTTNPTPPLPPDGEALYGSPSDEPVVEVDGEKVLDPDASDDAIDSVDADRLASGGGGV